MLEPVAADRAAGGRPMTPGRINKKIINSLLLNFAQLLCKYMITRDWSPSICWNMV
jgi:hypothetical protein